MKNLLFVALLWFVVLPLNAQDKSTPSPIIFIYDASNSMWGQIDGKSKMEIATAVLSDAVQNLPEGQQIGLVAYGHRQKSDCEDVEFLVSTDNSDKDKIIQSLKNIKPLGKTPLAYSATQVINHLRKTGIKATIILVTDGVEVCGGDICQVVRDAKKEGIDFRMHIVGFGLKEDETEQLKCAAEAGSGQYYDAVDASGLGGVLEEATQVTIDDPIDNYTVFAIKNGKAIDAYVQAVEPGTNKSVYQIRTYADTGYLSLSPGTYDLVVKPLEGSDVKRIKLTGILIVENKKDHRTVSFDAGIVSIMATNNGEGWDAVVHIFSNADGKKVTGGRTYGKAEEYELNPGFYDIELKAMIITGTENSHRFKTIEIIANQTAEISHNFETGIMMIGATSASGLVDAVIKVDDGKSTKSITSGRTYTSETSNPKKFIINPGTYSVTLNGVGDQRGQQRTATIVVKKGETTTSMIQF